jgi:hypothetical protein
MIDRAHDLPTTEQAGNSKHPPRQRLHSTLGRRAREDGTQATLAVALLQISARSLRLVTGPQYVLMLNTPAPCSARVGAAAQSETFAVARLGELRQHFCSAAIALQVRPASAVEVPIARSTYYDAPRRSTARRAAYRADQGGLRRMAAYG